MFLKNRTKMFHKINGKVVRPMRTIEVPDDLIYDKAKFKNIGEIKEVNITSKKLKKNKGE